MVSLRWKIENGKERAYSKTKRTEKTTREKPGKTPGAPRETPGAPGNFEKAIHALPILNLQAWSSLSCLFQAFRLLKLVELCFLLVPEE